MSSFEVTGLPADVEVSGRLMGPRCPGVSTIEIAYPLQALAPAVYRVVIPEPLCWSADRPLVWGALLAAGLLVVMIVWFGRACWGGWWITPGQTSNDVYMLSTIYERWANRSQVVPVGAAPSTP